MHPLGGQNVMVGPIWMDQNQSNAVPPMQSVVNSTHVAPAPTMNIRPRGPPKQPRQLKEGDWECPEPTCGNINFSKRTKCNRCGIPRPRPAVDQSTPHFGGPPGLFKQGDWPCPHCGNVNWARREKCNICNAPKPSIKAEPRTGRGGGHFDLQDPADRNVHHSDDEEYDEFGRKKKRKEKKTEGANNHEKMDSRNSFAGDTEVKMAFPPAPKQYTQDGSLSSCSNSSRSVSEDSSFSSSLSNHSRKKTNSYSNKDRRNEKEKYRRCSRSRTRSRSRGRH